MPAASKPTSKFATWDEMVAEANSQAEGIEDYPLEMGPDDVIQIPFPDGARYIAIVAAQRTGDAGGILDNLIPDKTDRLRVVTKMRGVKFPIVDVLASKVLRHFYGLPIQTEEKSGNSPGS